MHLRTVAAFAVLYFLGHTLAQCGLVLAHADHAAEVHISSAMQPPAAESTPGHAHIDDGSRELPHHDAYAVAAPRGDNPLRPMALIFAAATVLAVAVGFRSTPTAPRAPPPHPPTARSGRSLLNEICIHRC
ncbi:MULTISPECIES: hypothetical protein [Rhodococcus]|uniref:hypothetical protein n=2 Tax=Nocardiaceae TaxID=85025 RepID=UPI00215547AE|nr:MULTISPECIES: hypothetical protein [Rhodococcus]WKX01835.1 hypothetical protein Q3O43_28100 [Rhodococcus aetherivorans]